MAKQYRVKGPCKVAGVAPGGTVTREQVEKFGGDSAEIHFDLLVGTHLEEVTEEPPATAEAPSKKAPRGA